MEQTKEIKMTNRKKIIAISGSARKNSANLRLIKAIDDLTREKFETFVFEGLTELPHFNPDLDTDHPPEAVTNFRTLLKNSDGVLIYARIRYGSTWNAQKCIRLDSFVGRIFG
mgnify:CR=1 FL=1